MKLIEAEPLKNAIKKTINEAIECGHGFSGAFKNSSQEWSAEIWTIIDKIDNAPIIDAEPVRYGQFVGTEFDGYSDGHPVFYEWICSECGCVFEEEKPTYKYCPNCGARMKKL